MDLIYFGSGAFGLPTLETLASTHRVRAVVTQPDRPAGRGKKLTPNPIAAWASEHLPEAELIQHERVSSPEVCARIRAIGADAWVVIAFGQKLSAALLDGRFAINLHASLLPRWRGAAPINHAILGGDAETGNSVITLADRMDAGLVLGQTRRAIEPATTAGELHDLLAGDGPALVERVLAQHAAGAIEPVEQDEQRVTLAGKLGRADRWIDFADSARACRCRINGLSPWPGVGAALAGKRVKLVRAQEVDASDLGEPGRPRPVFLANETNPQETDTVHDKQPGTILDPEAGLVACGGGSVLQLLEVQPSGKRAMGWGDFARGHRIESGSCFSEWGRPESC